MPSNVVHGYMGTRVLGYTGTGTRLLGPRIHGYKGTGIQGCKGTRVHGSQVKGCRVTRVQEYSGTRVHMFSGLGVQGTGTYLLVTGSPSSRAGSGSQLLLHNK